MSLDPVMTAYVAVAAALADCAGHGRPRSDERANAYPENYKTELLGYLHTYINDPTQIHDAAIADPVLMPVSASPDRAGGSPGRFANLLDPSGGSQERYVVCVRYNAKDRDGRYTGLSKGWRFISMAASTVLPSNGQQPRRPASMPTSSRFPSWNPLAGKHK